MPSDSCSVWHGFQNFCINIGLRKKYCPIVKTQSTKEELFFRQRESVHYEHWIGEDKGTVYFAKITKSFTP